MWFIVLMVVAIAYAVVVHWFAFVGGVVFLGIARAERAREKAYPTKPQAKTSASISAETRPAPVEPCS